MTICAFAVSALLMPAMAQERQPDYKAYRTNTWSIYAQGGASWADGVDMQNVNAAAGTLTNPLVGGGLNYNIRPWLRLGLNYEFSQYGREQRFAEYQPISTDFLKNQGMTLVESGGGKAYSKMWTQFHAADFSVEFNIAELWQNRKAQWFNAYLGTGFGYMMANGNSYDIAMGYAVWEDPNNVVNGVRVGNSYESTSWLTAHNTRHAFNSPYVPATLSLEFDVTPRFTIGAKAGLMYLLNTADYAPKFVETAGLVLRINLLGKKQGYFTYKSRYNKLSNDYTDLNDKYAKALAKAKEDSEAAASKEDRMQDNINALEAANNDLRKANEDCAAEKKLVVLDHTVFFELNSSVISEEQKAALVDYIRKTKAQTPDACFTICGEASVEGATDYNRSLSDRRLQSVVRVFNEEGIGYDRILNSKSIGESNGIEGPEGRRVVIEMFRR